MFLQVDVTGGALPSCGWPLPGRVYSTLCRRSFRLRDWIKGGEVERRGHAGEPCAKLCQAVRSRWSMLGALANVFPVAAMLGLCTCQEAAEASQQAMLSVAGLNKDHAQIDMFDLFVSQLRTVTHVVPDGVPVHRCDRCGLSMLIRRP